MRLLHVYSGNLYGGIESMLLVLARARARTPELLQEFALCFEGRLSRELHVEGATVHQLPAPRASRPLLIRRARGALANLLLGRRFDRVICHGPWAQAMFGREIRRAGVPVALWIHADLGGRHWSEVWARRTPPDLAICNSRFTAGTLATVYRDVPATVIHPPVDTTPSLLSAADRRGVRAELGTDDRATVIIQASRSEPWKGHALLLEALERLRDLPGWVWWQVGGAQRPAERSYLDALRETARRTGVAERVRFVGERSDIGRLLASADIHCQANRAPEPFGVAFVEALAAGLPVVTVAMGGALEIVDDSCGILVPPADPPALAMALRRLISDPALRARLSAAAPERAKLVAEPAAQIRRLQEALEKMGASAQSPFQATLEVV